MSLRHLLAPLAAVVCATGPALASPVVPLPSLAVPSVTEQRALTRPAPRPVTTQPGPAANDWSPPRDEASPGTAPSTASPAPGATPDAGPSRPPRAEILQAPGSTAPVLPPPQL